MLLMAIIVALWAEHVASEVNTSISICQHEMPLQGLVSIYRKCYHKIQMFWSPEICIKSVT